MASCPILFSTTVNYRQHHHAPPPNHKFTATATNTPITFWSFSSSTINLRRPFHFSRNSWSARCSAPTPQPKPPSNNHPPPSSGVTSTFARFQDSIQIFLAVLFWISLFFWYCAWDGGDNGGPRKGSRFWK